MTGSNNRRKSGSITSSSPKNEGEVRLKKEVGLLDGVGIICGIIIGSGIFLTPKGVLKDAQSLGLTLVVWICTGLLSMIGAVCYCELGEFSLAVSGPTMTRTLMTGWLTMCCFLVGTTIPMSGGDYAYIKEAFGPLPAFLFLWDANVVFVPTTNAIMSLTFSKYVIQPFFPVGCEVPDAAIRLVAGGTIIFLTWLNCYNVRLTTRVQNVFLIAKVGGLLTIILAGSVYLFSGNYENFANPWANTQSDPGSIAVSFYSGIFSYAGWNYLNFMTEELKSPYKNLPRAIYISLPLVTTVYVLANIGYLAVLSKDEMLLSDAIGVTFGNKILGAFAWVMPVFVALSTFGGLSVHIMTSSRLLFVGARNGHFPQALSLISVNRLTPTPALVFLCLLSLAYLSTSDIFLLIEYASFVESSFILLSVSGLLWLRYKRPHLERPIKVPLFLPIVFLFICAFLVFLPIYVRPFEVGMGILITVSGIPVYLVFIWWQRRPRVIRSMSQNLTSSVQKIFLSAYQDHQD